MDMSTEISTKTIGNILKGFHLQGYFHSDNLELAIEQLINDTETKIGVSFQNVKEIKPDGK